MCEVLLCCGCEGGVETRMCEFSRHLLVTWEKIGSNFFGVCRVIFDDNIKNGGFQEVGSGSPIEKALVN